MRLSSITRRCEAMLVALAFGAASCGDGAGLSPLSAPASMRLTVNVANSTIATLVVAVSGVGIAQPLIFNLIVSNGFATGSIDIPPGTARRVLVQALDANGTVTYAGERTVDLQAGANPPITISLIPTAGTLPITVTFGSVGIVIAPASMMLVVGEVVNAVATIKDAGGAVLAGPPVWASSDPSVATVDPVGKVTAVRTGSAEIVASYAGVASFANVTVSATGLALRADAGADVEASFGEALTLAPSFSGGSGGAVTFNWRTLVVGLVATPPNAVGAFSAPTGTVGTVWLEVTPQQGNVVGIVDTILVHVVVDRTKAVWVAPNGSGSLGTRAAPMGDLALAAALAGSRGGAVYAAAGRYVTTGLNVHVSLYGGYDRLTWDRSIGVPRDTIASTTSVGLVVSAATNADIEGFHVVAADGLTAGASSIGLHVQTSTGVRVRFNTIKAGNGIAGAAGSTAFLPFPPPASANGAVGTPGTSASSLGGFGGAGGIFANHPDGGAGGTGGFASSGIAGVNGLGVGAGLGGIPGARSLQCFTLAGAGGPGSNGANGANGAVGALPTFTLDSRFTGAGFLPQFGNAGSGGALGAGGGGGGGGGGGSGSTFCQPDRGGGGGGGGSGGSPGVGGGAGHGGGGTFGVVVTNSTGVTVSNNTIVTGVAGSGGSGTPGAAGGAGGTGGTGGAGADDAAAGGRGGNGGAGGSGGGASGGVGGSVVGIVLVGLPASSASANTFTSVPGSQGSGGLLSGSPTIRSSPGTHQTIATPLP